jgi:hypothetical protein
MRFGRVGPHEGFGVGVGLGDKAVDCGLKVLDRSEHAAFEAPVCKLGEESFDCVEPGGRGWGEVEGPAGVLREPLTHLRVLVGGVVVDDRVDCLSPGSLGVDVIEEADELLMPVALHVATDDGAVENIEGGEQGGCAVALVVMCHGPGATGLHR